MVLTELSPINMSNTFTNKNLNNIKLQKLDWARRIVKKCQEQTGKVKIY